MVKLGHVRQLLPLLMLLTGCSLTSSDEVARVASPGDAVDAVLVETNGGATTSFGYEVYVVPHKAAVRRGELVADLYGAGRSKKAYGVNLRWESAYSLSVEYLEARQQNLIKDLAIVNGRTIRLSLKSGVLDPVAPGGGMLYNLQKRSNESRRKPLIEW